MNLVTVDPMPKKPSRLAALTPDPKMQPPSPSFKAEDRLIGAALNLEYHTNSVHTAQRLRELADKIESGLTPWVY